MKLLWCILLYSITFLGYGKGFNTLSLGEMQMRNCKVKARTAVTVTLYGCITRMEQCTIEAKTEVQVSCYYNNPSRNEYKTVKNHLAVSFAYDSTGEIYDSLLVEIGRYISKQEAWTAKNPHPTTDFTYLPFNESFFVNDSVVSLHLWTGAENPGDFRIFYVNKRVYKIELLGRHGLGSLSSFSAQNMLFAREGKTVNLGNYIKNTAIAREIFEREMGLSNKRVFIGKILSAKDSTAISYAAIYTDSARYTNLHTYHDGRFFISGLPAGTNSIRVQVSTYKDTTYTFNFDPTVDSTHTFYYLIRCNLDQRGTKHDCPICKRQDEVVPVIYGYPSSELLEKARNNEVRLGGCVVSDCDPHWYCKRCKHNY